MAASLTEGNGLDALFRVRTGLYLFLSVAYTLLPFDLMPEAVLGVFGLLDDLLIGLVVLMTLVSAFRERIGRPRGLVGR